MGVMKENLLRNAHDTTFSPTGLYNFVSGSLLTDSSGNGSAKNLTESDAPVDDVDFSFGAAEGLSHFSYYRNNSGDFNYTGAMSYACLIYTTGSIPDSVNNHAQLGLCDSTGGGNDARWSLQIDSSGYLRYAHQNNGNLWIAVADRKLREHYKWNHVAFTRDSNGTLAKLYFNGAEVSTNLKKYVGGSWSDISGDTFDTGPGTTGTAYYCVGDIASFENTRTNTVVVTSCAIYDQELTANQMKYLARKTLGYDRVK